MACPCEDRIFKLPSNPDPSTFHLPTVPVSRFSPGTTIRHYFPGKKTYFWGRVSASIHDTLGISKVGSTRSIEMQSKES